MNSAVRFAIVFVGMLLTIGVIYRLAIAAQGMQVTSWWRTPWRNKEVKGVSTSMHLLGLAWDIVPASTVNAERLRAMGLHVIDEGNHLHAQFLIGSL